jgi:hypothetical protein
MGIKGNSLAPRNVASGRFLINCAGLVAKLKECEAAKVEFARKL